MKPLMHCTLAATVLALCTTLAAPSRAEDTSGQVDFGSFAPPKNGGEFVEVNIPTGLITFAATIVEKEEPDVAKLLNGLKSVRVNVIGIDDSNRDELQKRIEKVRSQLTGKGWEKIVTAQEKDQDVGVFLKMTPKGAVQGLVAVVMDGKEHAVFVNVVGEIKPEQLAALGEKLNIDPLEKIGQAAKKHKEKSVKVEEEDSTPAKEKPEKN